MAEDATPPTVLEGDDSFVSLYRRYRPGTFGALRGQPHVVMALRRAVADGKVGHAYLFSGPRGTGKTSTARILAKALNCASPIDGEPCGVCQSCIEITKGTSLDVTELDAASNNGVDAMRDLVAHASLGTPGRRRVYIVDEVHMLSNAAANALLKTLEEPPNHVVFVLATTDPQKVPATIRSRTQHLEFRLLAADTLASLLSDVRTSAGLSVDDASLEAVVRRAKGSARDALSALDQVAAAGSAESVSADLTGVITGILESDAQGILVALAELHENGWGPQQLASEIVAELRQGFLALLAPSLSEHTGAEAERVRKQASEIGLARIVRTMEAIGRAQVQMRDAPEPHVVLELALVRSARIDLDDSPAALSERLAHVEARLRDGGAPAPRAVDAPPVQPQPRATSSAAAAAVSAAYDAAQRSAPAPTPTDQPEALAATSPATKPTLGALRRSKAQEAVPEATSPVITPSTPTPDVVSTAVPEAAPLSHPAGADQVLTLEALRATWETIHRTLPARPKAILAIGNFTTLEGGQATFVLPNESHALRARECVPAMVDALEASIGQRLQITCISDSEDPPASVEVCTPEDAPAGLDDVQAFKEMAEGSVKLSDHATIAEHLIQEFFPGAETK